MGILLRGGVLPEPREFKHMALEKTEKIKFRTPDKLLELHQWASFMAIAGMPGCGKTEWLLSLVAALSKPEEPAYISDLMDENSFLHDRAISVQIKRLMPDVHVILPEDDSDTYDPTLIGPQVGLAVRRREGRVLLDVGINANSLGVLRGFREDFLERGYGFHLIVNPFDPHTSDTDNVMALKLYLEEVSGLSVTGLIANAFEGESDESRPCALATMSVFAIAQALNLPLLYALADEEVAEKIVALLPEELPVWGLSRIFRNQKEDD